MMHLICTFIVLLCISGSILSNELMLIKKEDEEERNVNGVDVAKIEGEDEAVKKINDDDGEEGKSFVPEDKWKEIKDGQRVPSGLHYRINLKTGMKEAKRLVPKSDWVGSKIDQIKKTIHSIDVERKEKNNKNKEFFRKFKTLNELKTEFKKLKLNMKSESEIVAELMSKYKTASTEKRITILEDLEYYLHQIDVAMNFVKMDGIKLIIPDLNNTEPNLRAMVAFALGSAMQSNPQVQIAVLESSVLDTFLRLLALDISSHVKSKSLYAISCLIRNFPFAQKQFIKKGGIHSLTKLFKGGNIAHIKLQIKSLTLLDDLIEEQKHAIESLTGKKSDLSIKKLSQYQEVELGKNIQSSGFCSYVSKLLSYPDIDVREKVLRAMMSLKENCEQEFKLCRNEIKEISYLMKQEALERNEMDKDEDSYFTRLYIIAETLLTTLSEKDEL